MRENTIINDKFDFISILDVQSSKTINEHATFYIKGHIRAGNDEYVLRGSAGQSVTFIATGPNGSKKIFNGLISDIDIHTDNETCVLTLNLVSRTALMDIVPETRTFQDSDMTYQTVTNLMGEKNANFNYLWPTHGNRAIGSMTVQYKETDWQYAKRLASRLGTVIVPDYLLDTPYVSIGVPNRSAKSGIEIISHTIKNDMKQYRDSKPGGNFIAADAIYHTVKSREIFDLCDPIPLFGRTLHVYAIETRYEGDELVHYYTLKDKSSFHTKRIYNENLTGAALDGKIIEIAQDKVRVAITDDVKQRTHKWFPYATPFTQPAGYGWYFMPEIDDEIRLKFPSEQEHDAYVASAVHVTHGNRTDPEVKYIRTIYGQIIQFDPEKIWLSDGAGSSITMHHDKGITMETDKTVDIEARSDIAIIASGKIMLSGDEGVLMRKGNSVVNIDDAVDIISEHTREQ